jgi:FAD/FMN-containing dehydrogenase
VRADGSLVTANAEDHPDLFWAVRSGGGNFGIVTSFLYRACPVRDVVGGPMFWDLSDTAFSYREAQYSMVICGIDPDPANAELITKWTRDYWAAIKPYR